MNTRIEQIDSNFAPSQALLERFPTVTLYDGTAAPVEICGLYHKGERGVFCRLPEALLPSLSEGLQTLAYHTAGGRLRFRSDSPFVAVRVRLRSSFYMRHMPLSGSAGCDIYIGRGRGCRFLKMACPLTADSTLYEDGAFVLSPPQTVKRAVRDFTISLPLYNGIKEIYIGIDKESSLLPPTPYKRGRVVFYGSSITQGGCACRSGNSYDGIISRMLDCDIYNLGFSGSARGEQELAQFIATLNPAALVLDYDHNAPTARHLQQTHAPFFRTVRKALPQLPVIFMSRPVIDAGTGLEDGIKRREIIRATYDEAVAANDTQVYFIDGSTMFPRFAAECCTVDRAHPNDLGFMYMARAVIPFLQKAL